jgi:single-strand DNA-binding protein
MQLRLSLGGSTMANRFGGRGNLAAAPELKQVEADGEPGTVTEQRIYFDRSVPDGDGGFEDRGGFWLTANLWGEGAELAANLLRRGARVHVLGTLGRDTWTDKDSGEERSAFVNGYTEVPGSAVHQLRTSARSPSRSSRAVPR